MSWYNKELNRALGITSVLDLTKKPVQLQNEIKFEPNPLSNIPMQYRKYFHCNVCLQPFEVDSRRHLFIAECPNGHVYEVRQTNFGQFKYQYHPDIKSSMKHRNTYTTHQIEEAFWTEQQRKARMGKE